MLCIMLVTLDVSAFITDFFQVTHSFLYEFFLKEVHISDTIKMPIRFISERYELPLLVRFM